MASSVVWWFEDHGRRVGGLEDPRIRGTAGGMFAVWVFLELGKARMEAAEAAAEAAEAGSDRPLEPADATAAIGNEGWWDGTSSARSPFEIGSGEGSSLLQILDRRE